MRRPSIWGYGVAAAGCLLAMGLSVQVAGRDAGQPAWSLDSSSDPMELLVPRFGGERSFTRPSKDATIGFQVPTSVKEVAVVGGQRVQAGDLLVRGDDAEERVLMRLQEDRAATDLPVLRATEQHELAKIEHELTQESFSRGSANEQEVRRAAVSERIAEIDLERERWNHEQEVIQLDRVRERVARYSLRAPFDGQIDVVQVDMGDTIRETEPVVRVVRIDPLHIDVHVPFLATLSLDLDAGDRAWILLDVPGRPQLLEGRVVEVSPVGDFASRKQRVRVEAANPEALPTGLPAYVRFTPPTEEFLSAFGGGEHGGEG